MEIDLGKAFDHGCGQLHAPLKHVDTSGLPSPTRAIAILSSGIQVECDVVYAGMTKGIRRFRVTAEIDWYTSNVVSIGLDRWPPGIMVSLRVPDDLPDERCKEFGANIEWFVLGEKPYYPSKMEIERNER